MAALPRRGWSSLCLTADAEASASCYPFERIEFDVLEYDSDTVLQCMLSMFREMGLVDRFALPQQRLKSFLLDVRSNYRDNPYHNFSHAASVTHIAYVLLQGTKARNLLRDVDALGCMVAALCHDVNHTGRSNLFEINTESELALRYVHMRLRSTAAFCIRAILLIMFPLALLILSSLVAATMITLRSRTITRRTHSRC